MCRKAFRGLVWGYATALLVLVVDQWVKLWVFGALQSGESLLLGLPFLNILSQFNAGAAFSLLANAGGWQVTFFIAIGVLAVIGLSIWLLRLPEQNRWERVAVGMVIGGALGNTIDRIRFGRVFDFLDFHVGSWHYPTFNVADIGITVGVTLIMLCIIKRSKLS